MEHICMYLDVQGFYYQQKFYPREIAIVTKSGASLAFGVNHGIKYDSLNWLEKRSVSHCTNHHHGLSFETKSGISLRTMDEYMTNFFFNNIDPDHYLVGVKSKEAEAVCKKFGMPRLNLEKYGATWNAIGNDRESCTLHILPGKCSLNAVILLRKWVREQLKKQKEEKKNKQKEEQGETSSQQQNEEKRKLQDIWKDTNSSSERNHQCLGFLRPNGSYDECD